MTTLREAAQQCPSCEYNKQRAQLWRHEAYKLGGHPLDWEPELMVRPKPLTEEEIEEINRDLPLLHMQAAKGSVAFIFARAIEQKHGIGGEE